MKLVYFLGAFASLFIPVMAYAQKVAPSALTMPPDYQNWASNLVQQLAAINQGYLTICVTIIFAVTTLASVAISFIFYFFTYKPIYKEIQEYKMALEKQGKKIEEVETCVDKKAEEFISTSKKELSEISNNIGIGSQKQINDLTKVLLSRINKAEVKFKAENARAIALTSRAQSFPGALFYWWLRAAYYYNLSGETRLQKTSVEMAEDALDAIVWDNSAHVFLDDKLKSIERYFNALRSKHEVKMEKMERIFKEGIFSKNKTEATKKLI